MKLHVKLSVAILAGLLVSVLIAMVIQYLGTVTMLSDMSEKTMASLEKREHQFAANQFDSAEHAVKGSLIRGEMEKFSGHIENLRSVKGVLDFSLYDKNGIITHSSHTSNVGKTMAADLAKRLYTNAEKFHYENAGAETYEIYQPHVVEAMCVRCHNSWTRGEICGVTGMTFSTQGLAEAKLEAEAVIAGAKKHAIMNSLIGLFLIVVFFLCAMYYFVNRFVKKPMDGVIRGLKDLSAGDRDLTKRIRVKSSDELGELGKWFNVFIENIHTIIREISGSAGTVHQSSARLLDISDQMNEGAEDTLVKAQTVTVALTQLLSNMNEMTRSMDETSANVSSVASAAEEMFTTLNDIANRTDKARVITGDAVTKGNHANTRITALGNAAREIDQVTETITEISEQTNLLALNATIEAARAGEAGKGFAVVAHEIKDLARQTAESTLAIKKKIERIQSETRGSMDEIKGITEVVDDVSSIVSAIASSVEEQSLASRDISSSMGMALSSINQVTENVSTSATVTESIVHDISNVNQSTRTMTANSHQVNDHARELSGLSTTLHDLVGKFKIS